MRVRRNAEGSIVRLLAALLVFGLAAVGCGSGDEGSSDGAADSSADGSSEGAVDSSADDQADDDADNEAAEDAPAPSVDAVPAGTATVTIGETTYVADQQVVCIQIGEAIGGSWNDGAGEIAISIDLPPQDWETSPDGWSAPSVRIDDDSSADSPLQFQANPEMATMLGLEDADASVVTSWAVDGASASGTAVFVEFFGSMGALTSGEDAPAPIEGTFSLTCE